MQKVVVADGQDTIDSYCKEAVANLITDATFQADGVSTISMTIREEPMQSESVFDVIIRKRPTGYVVTVGPLGESPMIRYLFSDDEIIQYINAMKRTDSELSE